MKCVSILVCHIYFDFVGKHMIVFLVMLIYKIDKSFFEYVRILVVLFSRTYNDDTFLQETNVFQLWSQIRSQINHDILFDVSL